MLRRVVVRNWRAFDAAEVELRPGLNVLLGPNGAGKTSLLEAVAFALAGEPSTLPDARLLAREKDTPVDVSVAFALDVGESIEGRPIRGIEIRSPNKDAGVILISAGQHAREWIAMATGTCVADELVTRADEPEIDALLGELTFVIVPVVNPDGYTYTFSDERFWRKNRRDGTGVDITPGADFIGESVTGIDPILPGLGD